MESDHQRLGTIVSEFVLNHFSLTIVSLICNFSLGIGCFPLRIPVSPVVFIYPNSEEGGSQKGASQGQPLLFHIIFYRKNNKKGHALALKPF